VFFLVPDLLRIACPYAIKNQRNGKQGNKTMTKSQIVAEIARAEAEIANGGKKSVLKPYIRRLYAQYLKA